MRTSQLRAFDAVARAGSFTQAAVQLRVTQPAVTVQVRALEEAYGLRLLSRGSGAARLTADGQDLFVLTRQLFAAEEAIEARLSSGRDLEQGSLLLAADGPHMALALLARFRSRYPGLETKVTLGNAQETRAAIQEQRADVAVLANPPKDPRMKVLPIARQDMVVLLPRGHRWRGRKEIDLAELVEEPTVLREPGSNTRRTLDRALQKRRLRLQNALELGSREAVREAVAAGLGLGFIFSGEAIGDKRVVALPIAGLRGSSLDCLVCLKSQLKRRIVTALVDVAAEESPFAP